MGMMRQLERSQRPPQQQKQRKQTDSIKPTFLRTESPGGNGEGGVDHVVLLKVKFDEATKVEVRRLQKGAHKLATIDGVESVMCGEVMNESVVELGKHPVGDKSSGYNFYVRVRLKSVDKLKAFHSNCKEWYDSIDPILNAPPLAVSCNAAVVSSGGSATITDMDQSSLPQPQLQRR